MIGWRTHRRLARLVGGIRVPATPDIGALCAAVGERLDRPIQLLPMPLPADAPCGLVVTTGRGHYVAYDNRTTPLHQRHIVAHELGHLLAGHAARPVDTAELASLLMPTLDPRMVTAVLARGPGYDVRAEAEAEVIADLLWRRTLHRPGAPPGPDPNRADPVGVDPAAAEVVARIRRSLTGE